ncbi:ArsR/SmtB family transcription factor [Streptomyces sp. BBFR102]|uniref:ArsR/SmtB family transcription factor n=1 Tax=Streptomyces sp. BBFR102 TaxID=3448171 RepID=UPI003F53D6D9
MGWWLVGADTLATSRFVVSPLTETVARLMDLETGTAAYPGERAWLDAHLAAYRARLAADPVAAAVVRAGFATRWTADFLTPAPVVEHPSFEEELTRLRATPTGDAYADLAVSLGRPLPAGLRRPDVVERAAGLLEWVWTQAVRPYWPRRRRIVEADILARTQWLSRGGWAAALEGMGPGTRWLGEGRLQINSHPYPPRQIHGAADLLFVPVTPRRGWVTWDEPHRYAVVYPCDGVLAGPERRPAPGPLRALLGAARAEVLLLLGAPKSTTHLVALTGQGLGSVGRHLKVLHEAGLVRRRRAGRSVLYQRTEAGESLVEAGSGAPGQPR